MLDFPGSPSIPPTPHPPLSHGKKLLEIRDHPAASPLPCKHGHPCTARKGWTRWAVLTRSRTGPRRRHHLAARTARVPRRGLRSPPQCPHPCQEQSTYRWTASAPLDTQPRRGTDPSPTNWTGWGGGSHFPAAREGAPQGSSLPGPPRRSRRTCAVHSPRDPVSLLTASLSAMVTQLRPTREASGAASAPRAGLRPRPQRSSGRV